MELSRYIIIVLLVALLANAAPVRKELAGIRIEISADTQEEVNLIGRYAALCAQVADSAFACQDVAPIGKITIARDGAPDVKYAPDKDILEFLRDITFACLKRSAVEILPEGSVVPDTFLQFFANALAFRQLRNSAPAFFTLIPASIQAQDNFYPDPIKLMTQPMSPEAPALFQLHAMYSDMLLTAMDTLKRDTARYYWKLLELESQRRDPEESARFVLETVLPGAVTAQAWFRAQIVNQLNGIHRTVQSEDIRLRVNELQRIPVAQLNNHDTITTIPLENAPEAFQDYRIDRDTLGRIQSRFHSLVLDAPPLMQASIAEFANAIQLLNEQKIPQFRKRLAFARSEFEAALEKQRAIEAAMDEFEANRTCAERTFQSFIEIIRRYDILSYNLLQEKL